MEINLDNCFYVNKTKFSQSLANNQSEVFLVCKDEDDTLPGLEPQHIAEISFYGLIFLLGIIGNILVIFCITRYKRLNGITNQLLLSLAFADLLLIILCVPIKLAELLSYSWEFGQFLCKFTHYTRTWTKLTSVITLTAISLERYYAIARPLKAKYICTTNHVRVVITSIWVVASLLALPTLFVQEVYEVGSIDPVLWCDQHWYERGKTMAMVYESYMLLVIFLLPVSIMSSAYYGVCVELWAVTGEVRPARQKTRVRDSVTTESTDLIDKGSYIRGISTSSEDSKLQHELILRKSHTKETQIRQQVIKMLVTVVAIFVLCWGPYLCVNLVEASGAIKRYLPEGYEYGYPLKSAVCLLAFGNSCLNPLVYGFMSRYFRKSFMQALASCCVIKSAYGTFIQPPYNQNERSLSSTKKRIEGVLFDAGNKRSTISTAAADSTSNRSPPISPTNTCPHNL